MSPRPKPPLLPAPSLPQIDFWDIRVEKLMKKGRRQDDSLDLVWKPLHSVHLISLLGQYRGGVGGQYWRYEGSTWGEGQQGGWSSTGGREQYRVAHGAHGYPYNPLCPLPVAGYYSLSSHNPWPPPLNPKPSNLPQPSCPPPSYPLITCALPLRPPFSHPKPPCHTTSLLPQPSQLLLAT